MSKDINKIVRMNISLGIGLTLLLVGIDIKYFNIGFVDAMIKWGIIIILSEIFHNILFE